MVSACLKVTSLPLSRSSDKTRISLDYKNNNALSVSKFLVALSCIAVSVIFVPESPDQLASICETHNSIAACQVW